MRNGNITMTIVTSTKQNLKKKQSNQSQQTTYGICQKCKNPIAIPGLEAFKYSGNCGWLIRPLRKISDELADQTEVGGVR